MFLIQRASGTEVCIHDTDDRSFDIVKEREFCDYIKKTGRLRTLSNDVMTFSHDSLCGDIAIDGLTGSLHFVNKACHFICFDATSKLVRILDCLFVRRTRLDVWVTYHPHEGMRLCYHGLSYKPVYNKHGVSFPELESEGFLSRSPQLIGKEFSLSTHKELFIPYATGDIKKQILCNM